MHNAGGGLLLMGILRTSQARSSKKFAFSEFSEVGLPELRLLGSSRLPAAFGIMFLLIAQRFDPTGKPAREGGSQ